MPWIWDDPGRTHASAAPSEERHREKSLKSGQKPTFKQRVLKSVTRVANREFVLVTYHNVGMIDWATLFWGWLSRSGIRRFMLLELDGLTCEASRALNASIPFECVNGYDLMLPAQYTDIKKASSLQDWGKSPPRLLKHGVIADLSLLPFTLFAMLCSCTPSLRCRAQKAVSLGHRD